MSIDPAKHAKPLRTVLAWFLILVLTAALVLSEAVAFYQEGRTLDLGEDFTEEVSVSAEYLDSQRTSVDLTYHKEGVTGPDANVIFLLDASQYGNSARSQWATVMRDQGLHYLFDYGATSTARAISYQTGISYDTGVVSSNRTDWYPFFSSGNLILGQGVPDEAYALSLAKKAVEDAINANPDRPIALVWVLGDALNPQTDQAALEAALKDISEQMREGDAFITWQLGTDTPDELLSQYTTQHLTDPHDENSMGNASFAASSSLEFRDGLRQDIESIAHDHYHNITFTVPLAQGQTLVEGIESTSVSTDSPFVTINAELLDASGNPVASGELGSAVRVTLDHVCRQSAIDFTLRLKLNQDVYETQEVIGATTVESPADHSNGGLHIGLFDEAILNASTRLEIPAVELSRERTTMSFVDQNGQEVYRIAALPGTPITIPSADEVTSALSVPVGKAFGGWYGDDGSRYGSGDVVGMPDTDRTLTATYGASYAELDLGQVTPFEPGNRLAAKGYGASNASSVNLSGVTLDDGHVVTSSEIVNVTVVDEIVSYERIQGDSDTRRVKLRSNPDALYARWVGASNNDWVVSYLVPNADDPTKYDIRIAGRGGVKAPANCYQLFYYMPGVNFDMRLLDVSEVVNMQYMFYTYYGSSSRSSVVSMDLSTWDTSNVTNMSYMFDGCSSLTTLDVSNLDTSNVTNIGYMFRNCSSLTSLDVSDWDTSNVTNMSYMFDGCSSLTTLDVSNLDTSNVTNMGFMFRRCSSLASLDVSNWDTSNVTNMSYMFDGCSLLTALNPSNWNVSSVTDMSYMFSQCYAIESLDLSAWDTSKATSMVRMFSMWSTHYRVKSALTALDLSGWDLSSVTDIQSMFDGCSSLTTLNISGWDTSSVTMMYNVFARCSSLTSLDVSTWDTSNVTSMIYMFDGCSSLTSLDLSNWDTSSVTSMFSMFNGCSSLTSLDVSTWDTSSVTSMQNMFYNCSSLTSLDMSNWVTSKVTSMQSMFYNCSSLTTLDTSDWDTGNVASMQSMFQHCSSLISLDASNWDTSNVTRMYGMFDGCSSLTTLDVSGWVTSKVTDMRYMFYSCSSLVDLKLGNSFSMAKVNDANSMFYKTSSLTEVQGKIVFSTDPANPTPFNPSSMFYESGITDCSFMAAPAGTTYYFSSASLSSMFSRATKLETVDLSGWSLPNLTNVAYLFSGCFSLKSINLSWTGTCGLAAAPSPGLSNVFQSVPASATLEIGTNADARPSLDMIASAFLATTGRSVTAGGSAYAPPAAAAEALEAAEESLATAEEEAADGAVDGHDGSSADAADGLDNAAGSGTAGQTSGDASSSTGNANSGSGSNTGSSTANTSSSSSASGTNNTSSSGNSASSSETSNPSVVTSTPNVNSTANTTQSARSSESSLSAQASDSTANAKTVAAQTQTSANASVTPANFRLSSSSPTTAVSTTNTNIIPAAFAPAPADADWQWADGSTTLRIHKSATPENTTFRYRLKVGFEGDVGARSARINFELPLPDDVVALSDGDAWLNGDPVIEYSGIQVDGSDGGFRGGHVVDTPTLSSDGRTLSGSVEGLYAGNYIEVTIACRLEHTDNGYTDADGTQYIIWDATGQVRSAGNSGPSNTYRLWDSTSATLPDDDTRTVTYILTGDVPPDAQAPSVVRVKVGDTIPLPTEGTTSAYDWYTFEGWTMNGNSLQAGTSMPDSDVTIVGTWSRDATQAPFVNITYAFDDTAPAGAEALLPTEAQRVAVGREVSIHTISSSVDHSSFVGYWVPSNLMVNGQKVTLTKDPASGIGASALYKGTYTPLGGGDPIEVIIPASGRLGTMQFSDAFEGAGVVSQGSVSLTYTGSWDAWTGTVIFDANGGSGTPPQTMGDVTWYDNRTIPSPDDITPPEGYTFVGWALSPAGAVVKNTGDSLSGLVDRDGAEVTLYARYAREGGYELAWNLNHISASATPTTAAYGDSISSTLTADEGYFIDTVRIQMGGVDIALSAWDASTGIASFSVTGDTIVTASAVRGLAVSYAYTGEVPEGAPSLPTAERLRHDGTHIIADVPSLEGHTFTGWMPTLFVDGEEVSLAEDGSWTSEAFRTAGTIPTAGTLNASQFADLLRTDKEVEVHFTGSWEKVAQEEPPSNPDDNSEDPSLNPGGNTDELNKDQNSSQEDDEKANKDASSLIGWLLARTEDSLGILIAALAAVVLLVSSVIFLFARSRR